MNTTLREQALPLEPTISLRAWFMWLLAAAFYCYENLVQVSPGVMASDLMRDFAINATDIGNMGTLYLCAYAGMQIPVGLLVDRFGPRRLLTIASAICAIGCFTFATAHIFIVAGLARALIGLGSAFAVVCCLKIAATWFPLERFALLTGLMITIGLTGSVGGETPLAYMLAHLEWRNSMLLLAAVGAALTLLIWLVIVDKPQANNQQHVSQSHFLSGLIAVLKNKQTWLASIYGGLMYTPTIALGGLWGVPFLMQAYGLNRPTAAGVVSMLFLGWIVGSTLGGWISDRIGRRLPVMAVGSLGALLTLVIILYASGLSIIAMDALLFLFGLFSSGFLPAFSIVREINHPQHSGTAIGFINMLNMVGGAAAQPFIGFLLDLHWQGQMLDGARVYSVTNFHLALLALPICIGISLLLLPFVKETYCRITYPEA